MPALVLGVGWQFPVGLAHGDGAAPQLSTTRYEDCVWQSIMLILCTARGERVMRPDFGCGLHDLAFSINNSATQAMAAFHVREALLQWEPRIEVLRVEAASDGEQDEVLLVDIDYRVRLTDTRFNLVYPFYLDRPLT